MEDCSDTLCIGRFPVPDNIKCARCSYRIASNSGLQKEPRAKTFICMNNTPKKSKPKRIIKAATEFFSGFLIVYSAWLFCAAMLLTMADSFTVDNFIQAMSFGIIK